MNTTHSDRVLWFFFQLVNIWLSAKHSLFYTNFWIVFLIELNSVFKAEFTVWLHDHWKNYIRNSKTVTSTKRIHTAGYLKRDNPLKWNMKIILQSPCRVMHEFGIDRNIRILDDTSIIINRYSSKWFSDNHNFDFKLRWYVHHLRVHRTIAAYTW